MWTANQLAEGHTASMWQPWGSNSRSLIQEDTDFPSPYTASHTADVQEIHIDVVCFLDCAIQRTFFLVLSVFVRLLWRTREGHVFFESGFSCYRELMIFLRCLLMQAPWPYLSPVTWVTGSRTWQSELLTDSQVKLMDVAWGWHFWKISL